MTRRLLMASMVAGACALITPSAFAQAPDRPTVAIAGIHISQAGSTLPPPQMGSAITTLLVDQLVSSSQFHVIDAQWVVPDSDGGRHVALDRLRSAAEGQHIDYLVLGTVTRFATEQHSRGAGGLIPLPFIGGMLSRREMRTTVGLELEIVDVRSGEVVTTASAVGTGRRKMTGGGVLAVVHGVPLGGGGANRFTGSRDAMLDDALREAVTTAARALSVAAPRLTPHPPQVP